VVYAGFRRDALAGQRPRREKIQLTRGADVQHVEACAVLLGQLHGVAAGAPAGLGAADQRMLRDGDVLAVLRHGLGHVAADGGLVLGMHGQDQVGLLEEVVQRLGIVHQHIAGAAAQKGLQAAYRAGVGAQHLVQVGVAGPHVEGVVRHAGSRA
jgi:hypothetical protein